MLSEEERWQVRIDLAAAFRWAVRHELHEGICNHFSYAVGDNKFLINRWGLHWSEITASNILLADYDGHVLEGNGTVEPTAFFIHSRVHLARPEAVCALHTHQPYTTAISLLKDRRLEPIEQKAIRFQNLLAYDDDYNGTALDVAEGDRIAATLGNKSAVLMGAHGILVTGSTVASAYDDLYYLERAAQVQVLAMSTGRPLRELSSEVIKRTASQSEGERAGAQDHFEALKRVLDRDEADYKD
ncbi:MAG: aldolase [Pseudomonadota bacterium]|nr:aldolase [Pseudomonadota bacterium]